MAGAAEVAAGVAVFFAFLLCFLVVFAVVVAAGLASVLFAGAAGPAGCWAANIVPTASAMVNKVVFIFKRTRLGTLRRFTQNSAER